MPAFLIACLRVTDPARMAEYGAAAAVTVAAYGGVYRARGGETALLEGEVPTDRVVVVEFPSLQQAHRWYNSSEYAALKQIRRGASFGPLLFTDALDPEVSRRLASSQAESHG